MEIYQFLFCLPFTIKLWVHYSLFKDFRYDKESRCLPRIRATSHPCMMSEYFKSIFNILLTLNFKVVIKSVHDLKLRAL